MKEPSNEPETLTIDEACQFLRVSKPTLYRFLKSEKMGIPAYKVGRAWKFDKKKLENWVTEQIRESTAERKGASA